MNCFTLVRNNPTELFFQPLRALAPLWVPTIHLTATPCLLLPLRAPSPYPAWCIMNVNVGKRDAQKESHVSQHASPHRLVTCRIRRAAEAASQASGGCVPKRGEMQMSRSVTGCCSGGVRLQRSYFLNRHSSIWRVEWRCWMGFSQNRSHTHNETTWFVVCSSRSCRHKCHSSSVWECSPLVIHTFGCRLREWSRHSC